MKSLKRGGKMARKRREMSLVEAIKEWFSNFGDKLSEKEKPKRKSKKKAKRKPKKKS